MKMLWPLARNVLKRDQAWVRDYLQYAPQTNEPRRSILLLAGFLYLARLFNQNMHILELGTSAGLNMNWDKFHYDMEHWSWGPPSRLTLSTSWSGPAPPLNAPIHIASRAGCDIHPLELTDTDQNVRLRSYCWTDVPGRMARLDKAIAIALEEGRRPERARAVEWLEAKLACRPEKGLTVICHTIFLQYPPKTETKRLRDLILRTGDLASPEAPLAWLRFEPENPQTGELNLLAPKLDVITWPGGQHRLLARSNAHVTQVTSYF